VKSRKLDPSTLDLWPHQFDAVDVADAYFSDRSSRACLIHMPTGTGKTGIMAVLATRRSVDLPVLVVCPSSALAHQLRLEFETAFWAKIVADDDWRPDLVLELLPSSLVRLVRDLGDAKDQRVIVVGTIQALQQIHAAADGAKLKDLFGTVIFDEGHREPAPSWAKVVRGLAVPTVLFSATPFRGDLKLFDVDDRYVSFLSFKKAAAEALIRDVEIDEQAVSSTAEEFARTVIETRDRLCRTGRFSSESKMIVRGASEESVLELFQAFAEFLKNRTDGVIAMHHNFDLLGDIGCQQRPDVPLNLRLRPEKFLIHQFMLIEGIDDPSCNMAALYEPFENVRMLVQQVGRLVRQPGKIGIPAAPAYVLARTGDGVAEMWDNFLAFDAACVANGGKPALRNTKKVLLDLVAALPSLDYVEGKFRSRMRLDVDLEDDLRFPKAAIVYDVDAGFDLDRFQKDVSEALDVEDRFEHQVGSIESGECRYHVTLGLNQSPHLSSTLFQAPSLEVTIYARCGSRLFFYDSAGLWIDELAGVAGRVGPKTLRSLLRAGQDNAVSFLSVKNTDLGPLVVRNRTMAARSLERSGVFMGEHLNVVSRAAGRVDKVRRAVGFDRARVREGSSSEFDAFEFTAWCGAINDELDAAKAAAPILSRFATPADIPAVTEPKNILVDMMELIDEFRSPGNKTAEFDLENLCVDVVPDPSPKAPAPYRFDLIIDGAKTPIWIAWDPKKRKYWLKSAGLSKAKSKDNEKVSLTKRLNRTQPFRIITADFSHVYVHGSFYDLNLNLNDPNGAARLVLELVTAIPGLGAVTSEKGQGGGKLKTWPAGSLFRFIDDAIVGPRANRKFGEIFPAVVCDDLATEVGDFIGLDSEAAASRIAFVVAKWKSDEPGVSAAAFYDVCAQGVKNLAYLKSDGGHLPGTATKWDQDWKLSHGTGAYKKTALVSRRRVGPASREFRKQFKVALNAPTTDRSIWLVCAGGMLSKSALESEFKKHPPKPHVLQFYHLVVSAFSACQSVGVGLKIFCAD
jgi:hypothetical protein